MNKFPIWEVRPETELGGFSVTPSEDENHKNQVAIWIELPQADGDVYFTPDMALRFAEALRLAAEEVLDNPQV